MKRGWVISALLHLAIILLAVLGLPRLFEREPPEEPAMIVDMVPLKDETNAPPAPPPEPKPETPVTEQEPEPAKAEPKPVKEAVPVEKPVKEPVKEPEPPKAEPVPKPEPAPIVANTVPEETAELQPKPEPVVQPPAVVPKPQLKPEPPKPVDPFDTLLKDVAKKEEKLKQREKTEEPREETKAEPVQTVAQNTSPKLTDQPLSMTVIDLIRRQVESKWVVPAGAEDERDLAVELRVRLRPDGSVVSADIVDMGRMQTEPFFRTMAESARRAILNASPLQGLPPEQYEKWRDIQMVFYPPV